MLYEYSEKRASPHLNPVLLNDTASNVERFHKQQNKCVRLSVKVAEIFADYIYLAILYNNASFQSCCRIII